ncbi:hypothetical protein Vretimale_14773, partial [Volvox reticuliferus]
ETAAVAATTASCAATLAAAAANDAAAITNDTGAKATHGSPGAIGTNDASSASNLAAAMKDTGGGGDGKEDAGGRPPSLASLDRRLAELAEKVNDLAGDVAPHSIEGGRRSGVRTLKTADSGIQLGRIEDLDNKVNAIAEQSQNTMGQLRGLADKVAALEKELAKTKLPVEGTVAGLAAGGGVDGPTEMTIRLISEMETRLTKELGEALKELIGQAQDMEEIRERLQRLEAAAKTAGADGAAGAAGAAGADGKDVADKDHYVTTQEMQEVLDAVAGKLDGHAKQLKTLQRMCHDLLGDMQEAARDVGQMTVQLKTLEEHHEKLAAEVERLKREGSVVGAVGIGAEAGATGAATGGTFATARRKLRSARVEPSPGVVPPNGVEPKGAASWESLMAADEAARMRDLELDQGLQEVTEQLEETKEGLHIKQEVLQQILLRIARQVDKLQNHINEMDEGAATRQMETQFRISNVGGLQATALKLLQTSSRPTSPAAVAKMLASRNVSLDPSTAAELGLGGEKEGEAGKAASGGNGGDSGGGVGGTAGSAGK